MNSFPLHVCVCVRVEAGAIRRRHSATGSGCEGAKMCGGARAGGIQFISVAGKGALTNGQGQTIPRGKIQNLFHAICVSLALVCRLVWMVSLVSFCVAGVVGAVWFHLVSSGVSANLICGMPVTRAE